MSARATMLLVMCASCRDATLTPGPAKGTTPAAITVTSSGFREGSPVPTNFTCDGPDQSPDLAWTKVSDKTKSIALVVDDSDAPSGNFTHWILWNVTPDTRALGVGGNGGLSGGIAGTNDFDHVGYNGPCPPKGKLHHYRFKVYGLDAMLTLKPSDKRADLDRAMNDHIVAVGQLTATFQH